MFLLYLSTLLWYTIIEYVGKFIVKLPSIFMNDAKRRKKIIIDVGNVHVLLKEHFFFFGKKENNF